jgi:hypothetical protein
VTAAVGSVGGSDSQPGRAVATAAPLAIPMPGLLGRQVSLPKSGLPFVQARLRSLLIHGGPWVAPGGGVRGADLPARYRAIFGTALRDDLGWDAKLPDVFATMADVRCGAMKGEGGGVAACTLACPSAAPVVCSPSSTHPSYKHD